MGQSQSTGLFEQPLDGSNEQPLAAAPGSSQMLYRWNVAAKATEYGTWTREGPVDIVFETVAGKQHLLAGPNVDVVVGPAASLTTQPGAHRVIFTSTRGAVWCLKFGSEADCNAFMDDWGNAQFTNAYGKEATEANRRAVYGADFEAWASGEDPDGADDLLATEPYDTPMATRVTERAVGHGGRASLGGGGAGVASPAAAAGSSGMKPSPLSRTSQLQIGGLDTSFVLRGATVEVYRNVDSGVEDAQLSFELMSLSKTPLKASRSLLAHQERSLLLLTPKDEGGADRIHQVDVERGAVVATWGCEKDGVAVAMRDMASDDKAAQMGAGSTFLGLDNNRLCRWDMRLKGGLAGASPVSGAGVLSYEGGHDFSRGTNFSCMATTGDGCVAVGADDGRIRLYTDKSLRQAKTAFPGLGLPITAIDVTYDGSWVLATTDAYLLLLCTLAKDPKTAEIESGFRKQCGKRLLAPRLLRLRPDDAANVGSPFQKAKFTWVTDASGSERAIVTSAGNYTVLWDFKRARRGARRGGGLGALPESLDYKLLPKEEAVLDAGFLADHGAGREQSLVLATESDVWSCA